MNDDTNEHGSGFWFGMAVGGLIGALGSYLLTADEKQKKILLKKGKQLLANLEGFGEEVYEKGVEVKKAVEKKVPEVQEAAAETADDIQAIAEKAISEIAQTTQKAKKSFLSGGRPLLKKK